MERWLRWCVALGVFFAAAQARADAVEASPLTGIKLSAKGRLHLAISAFTGIDTNPNLAPYELITSRQSGGENAQLAGVGPSFNVPQYAPHPNKILFTYPPDAFVGVRPSFALELPTPLVRVSLNGALNYYEYLGLLQPGYPFVPGTEAYTKQMKFANYDQSTSTLTFGYNSGYRKLRTIDGTLGGGMSVSPKGPFGITPIFSLGRAVDPGPINVGSRLARTFFNGGLGLALRPGGGTMTFGGSVGANAEIYDPQNGRWFDGEPIPDFGRFDQMPMSLFGRGNPIDLMGLAPAANSTVDPSMFHTAGLNAALNWEWRFLPKSALFLTAGIGSRFYLKFWDNPNSPNFPLSLMGGFLGQITNKLGVVASAGLTYPLTLCLDVGNNLSLDRFGSNARCAANTGLINGQTGGSDADYLLGLAGVSFQSSQWLWWAPELLRWQPLVAAPVGQLEARYQITPTMTVAGGFRRQLRFVPLYRYISDNRLYASFNALFAQRVQLSLNASEAVQAHDQLTDSTVAYNAFPFDTTVREQVPYLRNADPGRWDNDLVVAAQLDFFILRWLLVGVGNTTNWHATNARTSGPLAPGIVTTEPPFNLSYVRNLTTVRVELRY